MPSMLEQARRGSSVRCRLMVTSGQIVLGVYLRNVWIGGVQLPTVFSHCTGSPERGFGAGLMWWGDESKKRQLQCWCSDWSLTNLIDSARVGA